MKNLEKTKLIFGYILIGYSVIGIIVALSYQFNLDLFDYDYRTFGRGGEGGASNSPIFYGLSALAGAILLATVKKEEKENNQ
jgi:hypothetical protein